MKRFHRYLETGDVHEKSEKDPAKSDAKEESKDVPKDDKLLQMAEALKAQAVTEILKVFPDLETSKHTFKLNKKFHCFSSNALLLLRNKPPNGTS